MQTLKFSHTIRVVDSAGGEFSATLDCETHHWSEGGFGRRKCVIHLRSDRCEATGEAFDHFDALSRVREALVPFGMHLMCYGASRNVFPSGMARDMGVGRKAYKMRMGQPATRADTVSIFAEGPDVEPASVQAQREFWEAWMRSNGHPPGA